MFQVYIRKTENNIQIVSYLREYKERKRGKEKGREIGKAQNASTRFD